MRLGRIGLTLALTGTMLTALGCGLDPQTRRPSSGGASGSQELPRDFGREPQPQTPNQDPDDTPTNIPNPIPEPLEPPPPGEVTVRAIAHSVMSNPLAAFTPRAHKTITVYANLTWTPVKEAASYRISRAEDGSDRFVVRATLKSPKIPFFRDGGTVLGNLNVGTEYRYLIEALDSSGRVVARGNDNTKPLYPLDIPALKAPENNVTTATSQPVMRWSYLDEAGKTKEGPDGFYVEVFSGQFLVPVWRGFRQGNLADSILYGNQVDFYPGTAPAIFTAVLHPGAKYTWSVTAYKTDTGNARTAKAFAKSNAPAWSFTIGTSK